MTIPTIRLLTLLVALIFPALAQSGDITYIDVRSKAEYEQGHIEGALLMPHTEIANLIGQTALEKDSTIVLYCRSGRRAEQARSNLHSLGYTNVRNAGGYSDLAAALEDSSECEVASC